MQNGRGERTVRSVVTVILVQLVNLKNVTALCQRDSPWVGPCCAAALLPARCREEKFKGLSVFLAKWRSTANKNIEHGRIIRPDFVKARKMSLLVDLGVELNKLHLFETHCGRLKAHV
jgi:hypothetical protein